MELASNNYPAMPTSVRSSQVHSCKLLRIAGFSEASESEIGVTLLKAVDFDRRKFRNRKSINIINVEKSMSNFIVFKTDLHQSRSLKSGIFRD